MRLRCCRRGALFALALGGLLTARLPATAVERTGDAAERAYTRGEELQRRGEAAAARGAYEQALALFRAQGREREAAAALNGLGYAYRALGDPSRALALHREAQGISHRLGA